MYDYLKGQITRITPEFIVLEQQGIGWQLNTPNPFAFEHLPLSNRYMFICMCERMRKFYMAS